MITDRDLRNAAFAPWQSTSRGALNADFEG
jgi:hypothetical protein